MSTDRSSDPSASSSMSRRHIIWPLLILVFVVVILFFGGAWLGSKDRSPADLLPGQRLPSPRATEVTLPRDVSIGPARTPAEGRPTETRPQPPSRP